MKRIILSALIIGVIFLGCKKEDTEDQNNNQNNSGNTGNPTENVKLGIETSPSAKAANDNKSAGVYKGTFIGSTGRFKLTINLDSIVGILEVDGVGYKLTTNDITTNDLGSAISNAVFSDAEGKVNLTFSVDANGENPKIGLTITGHPNIEAIIAKEKSTNQVRVYEGRRFEPYPDDGVGCISQMNVLLVENDTAARGTWIGTGESYNLNNGNTGGRTCSNDIYTTNELVYSGSGDSLRIYQWVQEDPNNPNSWIQDDWLPNWATLTETQIYSSGCFPQGGATICDSARLYRKL